MLKIIWHNFYVYMQNSSAPKKPCTKQNEAESVYSVDNSAEIWICSNKVWKPFGYDMYIKGNSI